MYFKKMSHKVCCLLRCICNGYQYIPVYAIDCNLAVKRIIELSGQLV